MVLECLAGQWLVWTVPSWLMSVRHSTLTYFVPFIPLIGYHWECSGSGFSAIARSDYRSHNDVRTMTASCCIRACTRARGPPNHTLRRHHRTAVALPSCPSENAEGVLIHHPTHLRVVMRMS